MTAFIVFVLAGIGTYLARGALILAVGERTLPEPVEQALGNVGPAVLAALTTSLLVSDGVFDYLTDLPKLAGTLVAIIAALKRLNILAVLALGMATFWIVGSF